MDRTAYENNLLNEIISNIEKNGGSKLLSSVILTGSFGRDEPTYITNPDGSFFLKSDIEMALIFSKQENKKAVNALIERVSKEFPEELNLMAISERRIIQAHNFNFALRPAKLKTIFTFDLYNGSKTIWGKDYLKDVSVSIENVDAYEAKRLVANRIGELHCMDVVLASENKRYFTSQWKGKLMLALGSAWLILKKAYVSSYHGQMEQLQKFRQDVDKDLGVDFVNQYEKVFSFLRESMPEYEVPDHHLRDFVRNIDDLMQMHGLTKPKVNCSSRMLKYFIKYAKTGMNFGFIDFENKILQDLITKYHQRCPEVYDTAKVWYRVLY